MTASKGSRWQRQQQVEGDRDGSAGHARQEEIVCNLPRGGAHGHQASSGTAGPQHEQESEKWQLVDPDQMTSLGVRVYPDTGSGGPRVSEDAP